MVIIQEASSSPSTHPWKYHVFLSFRGDDTRYNFTGHLCSALRQKGINTFMDDQLRRGEEISTALLQAIEQSRISIIVFSKNYASSRWCLEELVKILDCKKSKQQEVRPVFYKVDPSDIRNHRGSFGEALANHECTFKDNPDKVQKWKSALSEAAHLSGWPFLDEHCSESSFIHEIVEEISEQFISSTYLDAAAYPVGIKPRVQEIHKLLGVKGRDVHMVGIWGVGGIGKTTIAKAVYNSIAHAFDGSCFLENVREKSMGAEGFVNLQKKLLCEILGNTVEVPSIDRGITIIKERLQYKRVLLVLDDVNDMDQLNKLAGDPSWFGMGSKIIITTRDKQLLTCHSVDLIYKVKEWNHDEALELFSMHAFKRNRPLDGYAELTKHALDYAQGLPLALTVLGSSLYCKNVEKWEAALDGFESPKIREDRLGDTVSSNNFTVHLCSALQEILKLLGVEGRDVHMVGIWGAGGIGKTTIAKAVYNSIAHKFDGSCFLENVRENLMCEWCDSSFVKLQNKLLNEILKGTKLNVANVARGITMIKERLQYKSVLLVLDDVNDMAQLNNLAGDCSWFGMGSKIIITTRDNQLLRCHSVNLIYEVQKLDHHEALELFSMNAFKRSQPLDGCAELTERAIRYAQGLPLASTVLGYSLCNVNVEQWEAALDGFKSSEIRDVLKISYNGLDDTVKEIFLDIACFFKGEYINHVIQTLEAYHCKPAKYGISVLINKALINITSTGCIWMHDLIEEMGRGIVHQQSPNEPGKRSRLWFHADVYRVLTDNTGTRNVIGIKVELPEDYDVIRLSGTTFSNMRNLRLFIHRAGHYYGVVDNLPNSLRACVFRGIGWEWTALSNKTGVIPCLAITRTLLNETLQSPKQPEHVT